VGLEVAPTSAALLHEAAERLAQRKLDLAQRGAQLVRDWCRRFPKGSLPFHLVRLGGESHTLLRWRCTGPGCAPRGGRIELADQAALIVGMGAAVRERLLEAEQARITLNYEYALASYALARLNDLSRHREALGRLRRTANPGAGRRV
jgi:hypothetical protein